MNKQKKVIIAVLTLVVTMMVGYALFSETLTINGTATAKGNFDMKILDASITKEVGSNGATTSVIDNGNALQITIPHLEYPGAYVDVTYNVKNAGTISAIYTGYDITGETEKIKSEFLISKLSYAPEEMKTEKIRIYWDENNNSETEETTTIVFKVNYSQIGDKTDTCNELKAMSKTVEDCAGYFIPEENCPVNKYDFNHDGLIEATDSTYIYDYVYNIMKCPSN